MKILANEKLEISIHEDAVTAGVKFKINNATSVIKKSKSLVIKPEKPKLISQIIGRNHDSIPHTATVRLYDRDGNIKFSTDYLIPPAVSLKYMKDEGFSFFDEENHIVLNLKEPETKELPLAIQGRMGEKGEKGERGFKGEQGDKGDKGDKGNIGPIGKQGEIGPIGEDGPKGLQGTDGATGRQGETGKDGKNGIDGDDGVSFIWRGEWSRFSSYLINDVVQHEGSSFIAIHPTIDNEPKKLSTFWDIVALKGKDGDIGPKGEKGEKGEDGRSLGGRILSGGGTTGVSVSSRSIWYGGR